MGPQSAPIGDWPQKWPENAFCGIEIALNLRLDFFKNLTSCAKCWPNLYAYFHVFLKKLYCFSKIELTLVGMSVRHVTRFIVSSWGRTLPEYRTPHLPNPPK